MATAATFARRKMEVFFACLTSGFGYWLLFPSQAMASPALQALTDMASEGMWGGMFLTNGLAHCVWLAVNGARWWSPIVRFGAAFGAACLYLIWCAGFAAHDPNSTGVYTYGALAAGAVACCVFAWRDALTALRMRRVFADA